jgi:XTP/dITP diphosphohydrolase
MRNKFIVASKNKGKLLEIKYILKNLPFDILSMEDVGIYDDIEETGTTFAQNSMLKAKAVFEKTGDIVMADDSGLEVDFLGGAPGVFSARFAGYNASDADRINKLLTLLIDVPEEKRNARFVCCISVILPSKSSFIVYGHCEGIITTSPSGVNGFGYDPIFFIKEKSCTMAELSKEEKNSISHRAIALSNMKLKLDGLYKN